MASRRVARVAGALACQRLRGIGQFEDFDYSGDIGYDPGAVPTLDIPSFEVPSFGYDFGGFGDLDLMHTMPYEPGPGYYDLGGDVWPQEVTVAPAPDSPWYSAIPWNLIGSAAGTLITAGAPVAAQIYAATQQQPTSAPRTTTTTTAPRTATATPVGPASALPQGYGYSPTTGQVTPIPEGATLDARGTIIPSSGLTAMLPWLLVGGAALLVMRRRR